MNTKILSFFLLAMIFVASTSQIVEENDSQISSNSEGLAGCAACEAAFWLIKKGLGGKTESWLQNEIQNKICKKSGKVFKKICSAVADEGISKVFDHVKSKSSHEVCKLFHAC